MKEQKAKYFYDSIIKDKKNYKLVNGLFIVKHIDKNLSVYIGDFLKSDTARNQTKTNKVLLSDNKQKQYFFIDNKNKFKRTCLGYWKNLNISFIEKDISNILL